MRLFSHSLLVFWQGNCIFGIDMDYRELHSWKLSTAEALKVQNELRQLIRLVPLKRKPRLIAGADISYDRFSSHAFAAFVVLDASTLEIVGTASAEGEMTFPYVPGFLTFREGPVLLQAWKKLKLEPDVVVFDGQGIAHPRRMGIASHLGLWLDRPTIGCGKSLLTGTFENLAPQAGSTAPLMHQGEQVGVALRTRDNVGPVYVSPGHKITLEDSVSVLLAMRGGYRIPEPTRQAHIRVNELRRQGKGKTAAG